MIYKRIETSEAVALWMESIGYKGDLSPLCAALDDLFDGIQEIHNKIIPALIRLSPDNNDKAMDLTVDLMWEFDHLKRHCEDGFESMQAISNFIGGRLEKQEAEEVD